MVLLGFTIPKLEKLILEGKKRCTIRKPAKPYLSGKPRYYVGVMLNLYMFPRQPKMHKIFDAPCIRKDKLWIRDFTDEIAIQDGFEYVEEMVIWFRKTHKKYIFGDNYEYEGFDWIHWDYDTRMLPPLQKLIDDYKKGR